MILDLESKGEDQGYVVHRGSLMRELWTPLPQANLHVSKKLVSIQTVCDSSTSGGNEELVELGFEDGTTDRFDGVVGADGVFSVVRRFVLREYDWASVGPTPSGFWDLRVLVPYETAKNVLGETYFHDGGDRQHGWVGKKAYFLHDVLEDRTLVQCIMSGFSEEVSDDRKVILTRADLESRELEDWLDGPIASKMIDVSFSRCERRRSRHSCQIVVLPMLTPFFFHSSFFWRIPNLPDGTISSIKTRPSVQTEMYAS
jgi:salicylate hydroxylase